MRCCFAYANAMPAMLIPAHTSPLPGPYDDTGYYTRGWRASEGAFAS